MIQNLKKYDIMVQLMDEGCVEVLQYLAEITQFDDEFGLLAVGYA